jgi:hypothetical protein
LQDTTVGKVARLATLTAKGYTNLMEILYGAGSLENQSKQSEVLWMLKTEVVIDAAAKVEDFGQQ